MQITNETLHKFAETTVDKLTHVDHSILAVYLTGAMVSEENAFLGGTADIDLVFIHIGDPKTEREILKLTEDVHLDIAHHPRRDYLQRLELRTNPWMGPTIAEAIPMYDPQHFLDLTQASVRGLYHRADNVLSRSKTLTEEARELLFGMYPIVDDPGPEEIKTYLQILNCAANSIALLIGEPLTKRRFLLNFSRRAERVGKPGLVAGLLGMLGAHQVDEQTLTSWVSDWENMFDSLSDEERPIDLHPYRRNYYTKAFQAILGSENPEYILWPLIHSWTLAAQSTPVGSPELQSWKDTCQHLGILGHQFEERITALDAFLSQVEETVQAWGTRSNG